MILFCGCNRRYAHLTGRNHIPKEAKKSEAGSYIYNDQNHKTELNLHVDSLGFEVKKVEKIPIDFVNLNQLSLKSRSTIISEIENRSGSESRFQKSIGSIQTVSGIHKTNGRVNIPVQHFKHRLKKMSSVPKRISGSGEAVKILIFLLLFVLIIFGAIMWGLASWNFIGSTGCLIIIVVVLGSILLAIIGAAIG